MKNEFKEENLNNIFRKCVTVQEVFSALFSRYDNIHNSRRNGMSYSKMAVAFKKAMERAEEIEKKEKQNGRK